ncbi:MAG: DUF3108 domain-containing protein [Endomicrobia bacterium]|nr:DUF3108 domain-containing protein [Endomicrobiia bacterium]MCL2506899.1 DUF3108 domain-containing protein [Endomicrobiia bacterium]
MMLKKIKNLVSLKKLSCHSVEKRHPFSLLLADKIKDNLDTGFRRYDKLGYNYSKKALIFAGIFFCTALFTPSLFCDEAFPESQTNFIAERLKEERVRLQSNRDSFEWRKYEGKPLPEFEKLTFSVKWQFVTIGEATLELRGFEDINGREAHHIYSMAKTKPFFDEVFKVRDINEAWLDRESLSSLRFSADISEGGWTKKETLDFDPVERTYQLFDNGKMQMGATPEYVQDVMTALYYMRTLDLKVGESYTLEAHSGDMSWALAVNVLREEKIKVPAGEFKCLVLEPFVRENAGIMKTSGQMLVWVTNDERKIPVHLRVKIPIGAAIATLEKIETKK